MAETTKGTENTKPVKSEATAKLKRVSSRVAGLVATQRKPSPKHLLEELRQENKTLKELLEKETKAKEHLEETLQTLTDKVLEYVDVAELDANNDASVDSGCEMTTSTPRPGVGKTTKISNLKIPSSPSTPVATWPAAKVLNIFTVLLESKFGEGSDHMITRLEELETRVTEQAQRIASHVTLQLKMQDRLSDIEACKTISEVHSKLEDIRMLTYESPCPAEMISEPASSDTLDGPVLSTCTTSQSPLVPPAVKFPGDTHITGLLPGLRDAVITHLSHDKVNGADWQLFAERVGISETLLSRWKSKRPVRPMGAVLGVWGQSPGATVRMLHRHLSSPQLRCRMLAKRLSDFYQVD